MTEQQIKAFFKLCDSLDIRKFTPVELGIAFAQLKNETMVGLKRKGEKNRDDGGLLCIDTTIKPISSKEFDSVKSGTNVIYGAYAGTNWITGVASKVGKRVVEQHLVTKSFLNKNERRFNSREEFGAMVAQQIGEAIESLNKNIKISVLAVSFGFPQFPIKTSYGRDARLETDELPKSWVIKNSIGMDVGKYILDALKKFGLGKIKRVYFANDTTSVALDISAKFASSAAEKFVSLPVGFVMGTGDNASAIFSGYKNNNLVNLEVTDSLAFGADKILERMIKSKLTPSSINNVEYYMGGDYLLARLSCSMQLLSENGLTSNNYFKALIQHAYGAKVTSKLAAREMVAEELAELLHLKVNADDLFVLSEAARRMIYKGGQVAGTMVAAVCDLAGWGSEIKGAIPVEGTVFSQGFGFRESVRKTMRLLIPKNQLIFVPGSGTRGIATEAMIREIG